MNSRVICLWILLGACSHAYAFEQLVYQSNPQQQCFAKAMIGMDSVINASFGVPPEHALDLVMPSGNINALDDPSAMSMLKVILNAYLWKNSPHSYAVNVFYDCARTQGMDQQFTARSTVDRNQTYGGAD